MADQQLPRASGAPVTIVLCLLASMVEGLDIQSIGVAAPRMAPEFGLSPHQLGLVLAASPLGLLIGAAIGGRLADRCGRKATLIGSMLLFAVFSIATTFCGGFESLLIVRLLTGLGLGGALPNLIALSAEAVAARRRNGLVGLTAAGMPLGGVAPGLLAVAFHAPHQWRAIFWVGGLVPLLLAAALAALLPESRRYQEARAAGGPSATVVEVLFGGGRAAATVGLGLAFFCAFLVLYLLQNWLPLLMVSKGFSRANAGWIQAAFNVGGAIGAVALGFMMDRAGRSVVLALAWIGVAVALPLLGAMAPALSLACVVAAAAGVFVTGSQLILYGLAAGAYETRFRGVGVGFSVALGRVGSIVGPLGAAMLVAGGRSAGQVLTAVLPVVLVGGCAAVTVGLRRPVDE
jgi:AAHS family 3-hydroxyphenylpropionic acid transporter